MNTKKTTKKTPLKIAEWDLFTVAKKIIDPYELLIFANYEYARSNIRMVQRVEEVRAEVDVYRETNTYPERKSFEHYLKAISEYPTTPWTDIDAEKRAQLAAKLKEQMDLLGEHIFETKALQNIDLMIWTDRLVTGDSVYEAGALYDDHVTLFQIDFRFPDSSIKNQFSRWLKETRENMSPETKKLLKHPNTGKGSNLRDLQIAMKFLGAARLVVYYHPSTNYLDLAEATDKLYSVEATTWKRAKLKAFDLMQRMETVWEYNSLPKNFLRPFIDKSNGGGTFDPKLRAEKSLPKKPRKMDQTDTAALSAYGEAVFHPTW